MSRVSVSIYFSLCLKWQKKQPNTGVNTGNSWEHASQLICRPKMCCRVERQMYYHLHTGQRGIIKQRLPKYSSIFKCFLFVQLKINHSHVHFLVTFYTCDHGGTNMKTHEKKKQTHRETAIGYSRAKDWLIFSVCLIERRTVKTN